MSANFCFFYSVYYNSLALFLYNNVYFSTLEILMTKVNLKNGSNRSALRKLKCYSYNTLIKMVMKVPKDAKYYANLFAENPVRERFIWGNIIDNDEEIKLTMHIDKVNFRVTYSSDSDVNKYSAPDKIRMFCPEILLWIFFPLRKNGRK